MASCESAEMGQATNQTNGLLNFAVKIPGEATEYRATVSGPYSDGDTLYIKVPTTEEDPLDLTQLKPYASIENNCYVKPALPGIINFEQPYKISVVDAQGTTRVNYIQVLPTLQKTIFKNLWFKNSQEMNITRSNISGITVVKDNLLVHDSDGIGVYDRMTGTFKKKLAPPTSFTMQAKADEAGHFIVSRYNIYSAGFMVYYYEDVDSAPRLILNYTAAAGCPANLGTKVSVKGNLKEGKAYIYTTATSNMSYYSWEFNDGVTVSETPTIVNYANAGANWTYASVKRKSIDANSDHYITYCVYDANDATNLSKGSCFDIVSSDMSFIQMEKQNHYYKIFDFSSFDVYQDEFLAILHQPFYAWDGIYLRVFEITDHNNLLLKSDSSGYEDFKIFDSDMYGGTNYNRWGDVVTVVEGEDVYIYAAIACSDASRAGVLALKMKYTLQ